MEPKSEYKGLLAPRWYAVTVLEPNGEGKLRYGMTGTAKIYTVRHSLAGMVWRSASEFVSRKLW